MADTNSNTTVFSAIEEIIKTASYEEEEKFGAPLSIIGLTRNY